MSVSAASIIVRFSLVVLLATAFAVPLGADAYVPDQGLGINAAPGSRSSHDPEPLRTFYVSPEGDDENPGTEEEPWRTMAATATKLEPGDQAIFEDGLYVETQPAEFNAGTPEFPIVVQSRNGWHTVIQYEGRINQAKVELNAHVWLMWFDITQDAKGDDFNLGDTLVHCLPGADGCAVIGNKLHHTGGQCFWTGGTTGVIFDQNECFDATGWGAVTSFGTTDMIISNNVFRNTGNETIYTKGGSTNTRIFNNTLYANDTSRWRNGIILGGSSDTHDPLNEDREFVEDPSGWEAYNAVAWNNVIVAELPGAFRDGLSIRGCHTCAFFNNLVIAADYGFSITPGGGIEKGWTHETLTVDPVFKNNIFMDCREGAASFTGVDGEVQVDHNLFHYCADSPPQVHGGVGDPLLVNKMSDWRLGCGSPAIDAGEPVSWESVNDEPIDVATDLDGNRRVTRWDIGPYQFVGSPSACGTETVGEGFVDRATERPGLLAGLGISLVAIAVAGVPLLARRRRDTPGPQLQGGQQPRLAVYLESERHRLALDLVVHNLSPSPAYDVTLRVDPDKPVWQGRRLSEMSMFSSGIPFLGPSQAIRTYIGVSTEIHKEPITVTAAFYHQRDGDQQILASEAFTIDPRQFEGLASLPPSPDQQAAQALREIADGLSMIRSGGAGNAREAQLMTPFPPATASARAHAAAVADPAEQPPASEPNQTAAAAAMPATGGDTAADKGNDASPQRKVEAMIAPPAPARTAGQKATEPLISNQPRSSHRKAVTAQSEPGKRKLAKKGKGKASAPRENGQRQRER